MFITIVYPIADLRHLKNDQIPFYDYLKKVPIDENKYYFKKVGLQKKRSRGPIDYLDNEDFYFDASNFITTSLTQSKPIFKKLKVKYDFRRLFYNSHGPSRIEIGIRFLNFSKHNIEVNFDEFIELISQIKIATKDISIEENKFDIKSSGTIESVTKSIKNIICYSPTIKDNSISNVDSIFKDISDIEVFKPLLIIDYKDHIYHKLPKYKKKINFSYKLNYNTYYLNKNSKISNLDLFLLERKKSITKFDMSDFRETRLHLINFYCSFKYVNFLMNKVELNMADFNFNVTTKVVNSIRHLFNSPLSDKTFNISKFFNKHFTGFSKVNERLSIYDGKNNPNIKNRIFISYARASSKYTNTLEKFLKHNSDISYWRDTNDIDSGEKWLAEINKGIENSNIGILMLCQNYLASKTVINVELPALLKLYEMKKIRLYTILCEECNYEKEGLGVIQMANTPLTPMYKLLKEGTDKSIYKKLAETINKG
ncbi:toll/interleukin-1 receptor domain-containing protein [uncultured Algibacter sp.]|uniref:toll/interleukin-1 receptor domain-containing protein n=1 Tax=uncultured Algibacter sp. TaxID=298659 RepID=UPI002611B69B|nr:toll/interleukin-1 receptor domain-containing protein [uncultured Algibacter sp.]